MELRHLRYFVAVADQESFSRAARRLFVSQSSISEQISDLEAEIGVPLLVRGHRRTVVTEAGKTFLEHARRILADAENAVLATRRTSTGETGSLRIGFFSGGVGIEFPHLIRKFRERHPKVSLSLQEMNSMQQWRSLAEGRIDIGFTRMPEAGLRKELAFEVIQYDPIVAILPQNHRCAQNTTLDLRELANERFIVTSREVSPAVFDKVIDLCSEAGFTPNIVSLSTVWSSVIMMVQAGEGIALLPLNQQQFQMNDLAFVPVDSKNRYIEFGICWSTRNQTPILDSFQQLLRSHAPHPTGRIAVEEAYQVGSE